MSIRLGILRYWYAILLEPSDYSIICQLTICNVFVTGIVYCNSMTSWKPECIGGTSLLESGHFSDTDGLPSISPTTKWQGWIKSKYGSDTSAPASNNAANTEWSGFGDAPQPSTKPVTDPFSWISGGTFDGEAYTDTDSTWWNQGRTSDTRETRVATCLTVTIAVSALIIEQLLI
jgi:hypothetical protein